MQPAPNSEAAWSPTSNRPLLVPIARTAPLGAALLRSRLEAHLRRIRPSLLSHPTGLKNWLQRLPVGAPNCVRFPSDLAHVAGKGDPKSGAARRSAVKAGRRTKPDTAGAQLLPRFVRRQPSTSLYPRVSHFPSSVCLCRRDGLLAVSLPDLAERRPRTGWLPACTLRPTVRFHCHARILIGFARLARVIRVGFVLQFLHIFLRQR